MPATPARIEVQENFPPGRINRRRQFTASLVERESDKLLPETLSFEEIECLLE